MAEVQRLTSPDTLLSRMNQYQKGNPERKLSAAGVFAQCLIQAGRVGVQESLVPLNLGDNRISRLTAFQRLKHTCSPDVAYEMLQQQSAILLGSIILGMEEAFVNRQLDLSTIVTIYNNSLVGTGLEGVDLIGDTNSPISSRRQRQYLRLAEEDPSLLSTISPLPSGINAIAEDIIGITEPLLEVAEMIAESGFMATATLRERIRIEHPEAERHKRAAAIMKDTDELLAQLDICLGITPEPSRSGMTDFLRKLFGLAS